MQRATNPRMNIKVLQKTTKMDLDCDISNATPIEKHEHTQTQRRGSTLTLFEIIIFIYIYIYLYILVVLLSTTLYPFLSAFSKFSLQPLDVLILFLIFFIFVSCFLIATVFDIVYGMLYYIFRNNNLIPIYYNFILIKPNYDGFFIFLFFLSLFSWFLFCISF